MSAAAQAIGSALPGDAMGGSVKFAALPAVAAEGRADAREGKILSLIDRLGISISFAMPTPDSTHMLRYAKVRRSQRSESGNPGNMLFCKVWNGSLIRM